MQSVASLVEDKRSGIWRKSEGRVEVVDGIIDRYEVTRPHVFGSIDSEPGDTDL